MKNSQCYRRGAEMQKYLIKKKKPRICRQGELFKNLNYEECCRERTEKENEMWETNLCSHSSSSLHLSEPEVLSQHLWTHWHSSCSCHHQGTQGYKHLTHRSATAAALLSTVCFLSARPDNEEAPRAVLWKYRVQNNAKTEKLAPVIWIWEPRQWKALTLIFVLQLPSALWNRNNTMPFIS